MDDFRKIDLPILTVTSEFGTVLMWDWNCQLSTRRRVEYHRLTAWSRQKSLSCPEREARTATPNSWLSGPPVRFRPASLSASTGGKMNTAQRMMTKFGVTIVKEFKEMGSRLNGSRYRSGSGLARVAVAGRH
ncbi:hypothetical protein [Candidatus Amarobacter glycogenicus]|uniref:hypothetical protein n=1 Tax=Candidatus Amarobacter glycogenicus TaxID=3140699 RepID=UPI002A0E1519|nr:hypothetical protein [Dehalococcoidia bacterium]